jgi:hypothetical protein
MRKKSISDECLALAATKCLRLKLNKCKSELDMVVLDRKNSLSKEKLSHNSNLNKKMKKKFKNFTKLLFNGSSIKKINDKENISKCDNLVNLRKQSEDVINFNHINRHKDSVFFTTTTTTVMTQQDFSDMIVNANERLDSVKIEMMNNINKLIERENGLIDLEAKANNLSLNTIDLNQTSNSVKKTFKMKFFNKKLIYILIYLFAFASAFITMFVLMNNYVTSNYDISKNKDNSGLFSNNLTKTSKRHLLNKLIYFLK